MKRPTRDLLVMLKQELYTPQAIEHEVNFLHGLLFNVERSASVHLAHELININKYKIITSPFELKKAIRSNTHQPFVFLNNKN